MLDSFAYLLSYTRVLGYTENDFCTLLAYFVAN